MTISAFPVSPERFDALQRAPHVPEKNLEERRHYRSVWVSDVHLGTRGCNADMLIDFFDHVDCDVMYLVGDIIDGWRLKKRMFWPPEHNDIVWRVLKRARRGTRVIYIPGNHDEMMRPFVGLDFGGIEIEHEVIHTTADGRRLLVLHGDQFDAVVMGHRWLAVLGDTAYTWLLRLNTVVNRARSALGLSYVSLSMTAKHRVKNAVQFIGRYEEVVAAAAREHGVDGVVCGHIHSAEMRDIDGIAYYNDGDWVEGCTALVEHADGRMEILRWADEMLKRARPATPATAPAVIEADARQPVAA